jgi:transposase InsO family protein
LKELSDKSRRPKVLAHQKVTSEIETLILSTRKEKNWGPQRISNFLLRKKDFTISSMTVHRYLVKNGAENIRILRKKTDYVRYNRPVPGDRVQLDVTKIRPGAYQFTAIDDCTRLRVIRIYPNKKASSTIQFLHEITTSFTFPIQRIQTDWGTEFFNYSFQEELHEHFIKFRPIRPRSPHLNGKVERSQQTDKTEFWSLLDLKDETLSLNELAKSWQEFYNKKRSHSSLGGKTPWEKFKELEHKTPYQYEVTSAFQASKEEVKPRNSYYLNWIKKQQNNF